MRNTKATQLLFELSKPGRRCMRLPDCDVPDTPLDSLLPAEAMADIYRHVGVPVPQEPPDMGGPRFSARHPRLGSIHPTVKRVLHWGRGGDTLLHRASFRVARALREANLAPGTPRLDPRMRERLGAIFAESNERLAAWLGRPLPWQ